MTPINKISGILLGTAVGDALGLPSEGMKPSTINKLGWTKHWKHRFLFSRGMWSDDTEHTIMLTQALLASEGDVKKFTAKFAWELRWWLLGLPAGVGMATARSIIKLWLGFPASRSGVFSAGNGPMMRTAIIAASFPEDSSQRRSYTSAHTRLTHSDPKALTATLAITELTVLLIHSTTPPAMSEVLKICQNCVSCHVYPSPKPPSPDDPWLSILEQINKGIKNQKPLSEFLTSIGINPADGISGYAYHTVPAVIYAGVLHGWDYRKTITSLIAAGGDTDSTAAIAGALCGAYGGVESVPIDWINHLSEWPATTRDLNRLAKAVHSGTPLRIRPRWSPALLLRNLVFFITVLIHGFARLLPAQLRGALKF